MPRVVATLQTLIMHFMLALMMSAAYSVSPESVLTEHETNVPHGLHCGMWPIPCDADWYCVLCFLTVKSARR